MFERSHGAQGGSEGRASPAPWWSAIAGVEVGQPRSGRAVGGASMVERARAEIRRNCDGLRVTESRSGGAGGDRAAQEALCGAVGLVALVGRAIYRPRTDRGADARLSVFGERGQRDAPGAATHASAGGASAGRGSASLD